VLKVDRYSGAVHIRVTWRPSDAKAICVVANDGLSAEVEILHVPKLCLGCDTPSEHIRNAECALDQLASDALQIANANRPNAFPDYQRMRNGSPYIARFSTRAWLV